MRSLGLNRYALSSCVAAALLAGCGGSRPPIGVPGTTPQTASLQSLSAQHDRSGSWMAPEAVTQKLLYVSNAYTVTVYSYPRGKHVGTLRHFLRPLGECVDQQGDVFVADGTGQIFEYAHGGTRRIGTLSMQGYSPESCAVDPTTGNLAVTWDKGVNKGGYVAVYADAKGSPTLYSNGNMEFDFCGFDNLGNLWVDGVAPYMFAFAELPKGSSGIVNISLNQSIEFPGPVQWDGRYVAVGDQATEMIYRFAFSGSNGTLEGSTSLGGAQTVIQWWIEGGRVVGSDEQEPDTTRYWEYPAGGAPIRTLQLKGIGAPFGATISK
jgi:hypothetical protein